MAMDWGSMIGSAAGSQGGSGGGASTESKVSGIVGSVEGTAGLIQMLIGLRNKRNLLANRPQLGVTPGEAANTKYYNQAASATEMPGQKQFEEKLGQTYAEGVGNAQRTAISSIGATQSANDLAMKKMQAIQDLAGQFAEFKQQRQDALARWNEQRINLDQQRWQMNTLNPYMMRLGQSTADYQNGFNTMIAGGERIAGAVANQGSGQNYGAGQGYGNNMGGWGMKSNPSESPTGNFDNSNIGGNNYA